MVSVVEPDPASTTVNKSSMTMNKFNPSKATLQVLTSHLTIVLSYYTILHDILGIIPDTDMHSRHANQHRKNSMPASAYGFIQARSQNLRA